MTLFAAGGRAPRPRAPRRRAAARRRLARAWPGCARRRRRRRAPRAGCAGRRASASSTASCEQRLDLARRARRPAGGRAGRRRRARAAGRPPTLSTTLFGTMIESSPLRERRVEQAERADDALDLAGDRAALQAHAVADPERPRAEQHGARRSGCRASAGRRDRG